MLDLVQKLLFPAFLLDGELPVVHRNLETSGRECPGEHHLLGVLADVDEAPAACELGSELAHVQVPFPVSLGQAEEAAVEAAPVVEIELVGLIDHAIRVGAGAEAQPAGRQPTDDSRLCGECDIIQHLLLVRHIGHPLGHPDAEVYDAVLLEFERCPACDDFSGPHRHGKQ